MAVTDLAMRTCGGAAFGGAPGSGAAVPRRPRADRHGADDRSGLRLHRPRAVRPGAVLMAAPLSVGAVLYDPKVSVIWEIIRDFFESQGVPDRRRFLQHLRAAGRRRSLRRRTSTSPGTRRSRGSTRSADPAAPAARSRCATPIAIASRYFVDADGRAGAHAGRSARAGRSPSARSDSPQATLIPLGTAAAAGLDRRPRLHRPALRRAGRQARRPRRRRARGASSVSSAARPTACAMLDLNWEAWTRDGTIDPARVRDRSRRRPAASITASSRSATISTPRPNGAGSTALFAMRYDEPDAPRDDGPRRAEGVAARAARPGSGR